MDVNALSPERRRALKRAAFDQFRDSIFQQLQEKINNSVKDEKLGVSFKEELHIRSNSEFEDVDDHLSISDDDGPRVVSVYSKTDLDNFSGEPKAKKSRSLSGEAKMKQDLTEFPVEIETLSGPGSPNIPSWHSDLKVEDGPRIEAVSTASEYDIMMAPRRLRKSSSDLKIQNGPRIEAVCTASELEIIIPPRTVRKPSTDDVQMLGVTEPSSAIQKAKNAPVACQPFKTFMTDEIYEILDDDSMDAICMPSSPVSDELHFNFDSSSDNEESQVLSIVQSGPSNVLIGASGLHAISEKNALLPETAGVEMLGVLPHHLALDDQTFGTTAGGYKWFKFKPPKTDIPFFGTEKLNVPLTGTAPINFFELIIDDEFCQTFIAQIEICATEMMKENVCPRSLISKWTTLTRSEFRKWLGILILMGRIQLPSFASYWSSDPVFCTPPYCADRVMSKGRWMGIMQALHFVKRPGFNETSDPLFKVNPFINWFNKRMKTVYSPNKQLCINEAVVLWQGRVLPLKCLRDKSKGIKLDVLCDSGGMILRFGATKWLSFNETQAQKSVKMLLKDFFGKGHSVFIDEMYNSIALSHELLSQRMYSTGVLKSKEDLPKGFVNSAKYFYCYSNNGICLMKCKQENDDNYTFLSSEFGPEIAEVSGKKGPKFKPVAVAEYDKQMSLIDKQYQVLADNTTVHKLTKNHVRLMVHIFHMAVYNAYLLYKKFGPNKHDYLGFRNELSKSLVGSPSSVTPTPVKKFATT